MPAITIVEASAGSGKTYALALEFLRLLLSNGESKADISEFLAVTFTNKASFEMKERVIRLLKKTALDIFESCEERERFYAEIALDPRLLKRKALAAADDIISSYGRFRVQTIDSLVNSILESNPLHLGLPVKFRIKNSYAHMLEYSLDELISLSATNPGIKKVMLDFIDSYLNVENKTGWFPKQSILEIVSLMLTLADSYGKTPKKRSAEPLWSHKKRLFEKTVKLKKRIPEGTKKSLLNILEAINSPEDIRTDKIINKTTTSSEFPVRKGFEPHGDTKLLWEEFIQDIKSLCEAEAYTRFNPYIEIFSLVFENLKVLSHGQNVIFLQELNRRASPIFRNELITADELFLRLSSRFRNYMLDEFQDTSLLQWTNLAPLIDEAISTGGSLFCVGDRKQAIYRFRGGDFTLAERITRQYKNHGVQNKKLSNNYRSLKHVVEFNNRIFSRRNLTFFLQGIEEEILPFVFREDILKVFSNSEQKAQPRNAGGYVCARMVSLETAEERDEDIREKLLNITADLGRRIGSDNTAVLTRDNREAEKVSEWLISAGIPVQSDRTLDIRQNGIVKELLSLLAFLNSPVDNLSFAVFIQGDIFKKAARLDEKEIDGFMFKWARESDVKSLYASFRDDFPEAWHAHLEDFHKSSGLIPLYEFVLEIIARFSVLKNFPDSHAVVMKLLEVIKDAEEEQEDIGIHSFFEYLELSQEEHFHLDSLDNNSVKVMTIHKAKGLEFDAVIIPFFQIEIKPDTRIGSSILNISGEDLNLLKITAKHRIASKHLADIYALEYQKAVIDELNVSYVALTRAKRELFVLVPDKIGRTENKAVRLIGSNFEIGEKSKKLISNNGLRKNFLKPSEHMPSPEFLSEELKDKSPEHRSEQLSGEAAHYILSRFEPGRRESLKDLAAEAATRGFFLQNEQGTLEKIETLLNDPDFKRVFTPGEEGIAHTEVELVGADGLTRRMDRLIIEKDSVRVVDFKMSQNKHEDFLQLRGYISILREVFPGKHPEGFVAYITSGKTVKLDE